jgi:hypothetical protein
MQCANHGVPFKPAPTLDADRRRNVLIRLARQMLLLVSLSSPRATHAGRTGNLHCINHPDGAASATRCLSFLSAQKFPVKQPVANRVWQSVSSLREYPISINPIWC